MTNTAKQPRYRQLSEAEMAANRAANRAVLVDDDFDFEEVVSEEIALMLREPREFASRLPAKSEG